VDYRAYGMEVMDAPRPGPGYTGHYRDVGTGLVYMQQRYYDPLVGRFLSVDPVATDSKNGWNFNRYNYAANNPYRFTDPDGRNSCATPQGAPFCLTPELAGGAGAAGGTVSTGGAEVGVYVAVLAEAVQGEGSATPQEPARSPEEVSQEAIDRIKHGTRPADGKPGQDGVRVGAGGQEGVEIAKEIARGTEGSTERTYPNGTTVITLPDGRKVETHRSTKGGQYEGAPTVKIQDADGKVRPENIIRYPEQ